MKRTLWRSISVTLCWTALVLLAACSKKREGDARQDGSGARHEEARAVAGTASVHAVFDDHVGAGAAKTIDFRYGATMVIGEMLYVELTDRPTQCGRRPDDDAWVLLIAAPAGPGGDKSTFGTVVQIDPWKSFAKQRVALRTIESDAATITVDARSNAPDARVVGKLDLHYAEIWATPDGGTKHMKYEAQGAFDVPVCDEANLGTIAPAPKLGVTGLPTGVVAGKPFTAKKAIVKLDYPCAQDDGCVYSKGHPPDPLQAKITDIILGEDPQCDGIGQEDEIVLSAFGGATARHNDTGRWQPASIVWGGEGHQIPWGAKELAWMRFEKSPIPPPPGSTMQVTITARAGDGQDLSVAGTIQATVCKGVWE